MIFCALFCNFFVFAQNFATQNMPKSKFYEGKVTYNQTLFPGDPIVLKLILTPKSKKIKKNIGLTQATLYYFLTENPEKIIRTTKMYPINKAQQQKNDVLMAMLPTSSFLEEGTYTLKIVFTPFLLSEEIFTTQVQVKSKEFVSETIPLNDSSTAIKTNYSKERLDQINRLNKILETVNPDSIYETTSFTPPTPATRRTSFFADRRVFAYSNGKSSTSLHYGIDYGVPTGSEVRSCGRGKVVMAENRISTGWSVCIEHLPGLYSLYYHMSKLNVEVGQIVEKGKLLGLSGSTGLATGPHLHWEVRLNIEAVNPDFFTEDFF